MQSPLIHCDIEMITVNRHFVDVVIVDDGDTKIFGFQ